VGTPAENERFGEALGDVLEALASQRPSGTTRSR
jgi:hypothetical protein